MSGHGAWTNYETYRVVIDIFEVNGCLEQAVDATRAVSYTHLTLPTKA